MIIFVVSILKVTMSRIAYNLFGLVIAIGVLLALNLMLGSVDIPAKDVIKILSFNDHE